MNTNREKIEQKRRDLKEYNIRGEKK